MPRKKNELVKKSNAIIRTQWKIESVWEPRLVAHLASKIHVDDKDFETYKIPLAEILGQNYSGRDLVQLEEAAKNIIKHPVTIQHSPKRRGIYPILSKCVIDAGTGYVELRFDADLKPHFLQLQKNFTRYKLAEFLTLHSSYSQRLFEILMSYSGQDYVELTLDELYKALDFPVALRGNFARFRQKVLEQAYKEIVKGGLSLQYDWTPLKGGRGGKVTAVRFVFSDVPKPPDDTDIIRAKLHKQASTCYLRLMKRGVNCTPKAASAKCAVCVTQPWHVNKHDGKAKQHELNLEGNAAG